MQYHGIIELILSGRAQSYVRECLIDWRVGAGYLGARLAVIHGNGLASGFDHGCLASDNAGNLLIADSYNLRIQPADPGGNGLTRAPGDAVRAG